MIYIIGGVNRAGKSILTRRLAQKYNLPYFNLDNLMLGLVNSPMDFGFEGRTHDKEKARKMWHIVKPMLKSTLVKEQEGYIIEGVTVLPEQLNELKAELSAEQADKIKACWLGYANATMDEKFKHIRNNHGLAGDWLMHEDDDRVNGVVESGIKYSKDLKQECEKYNIAFVDTFNDFDLALNEAEAHLLNINN